MPLRGGAAPPFMRSGVYSGQERRTGHTRADELVSLVEVAAADHVPNAIAASTPCLGTSVASFDVTAAAADVTIARVVLTRGLYRLEWYVTCSDTGANLRRFDIEVDSSNGNLLCRSNGIIHDAGGPRIYQGEMTVWMGTVWRTGNTTVEQNPCIRARTVEAGLAANVTIGHIAATRLWTDLKDRTT